MIKGSLSLMLSQGQRPLPGVLYGDCLFSAVYGLPVCTEIVYFVRLTTEKRKGMAFDHAFLVLFLSL